MRLRDLISTPPEMCGSHISIAQAAREMASAGVGSMGVIEEGRFAGIITERDVLEAVARGFDIESEPVRCCMTRNPDVFSPDTDVHRAATRVNVNRMQARTSGHGRHGMTWGKAGKPTPADRSVDRRPQSKIDIR